MIMIQQFDSKVTVLSKKMFSFCTQSRQFVSLRWYIKICPRKSVLQLDPCKKCTVKSKVIFSPPWWGSMTSILAHLPTILYWTIGPSSCWIASENILLLKRADILHILRLFSGFLVMGVNWDTSINLKPILIVTNDISIEYCKIEIWESINIILILHSAVVWIEYQM